MKSSRIFIRCVRDSFKSLVRNFSLSLAAMLSVTITLILVSFSVIMAANINYTTTSIEEELSIVVYLVSDITDEEANDLEEEITDLDKVSYVTYKSKEEWKTEMSENDETFKIVLDYLEENPLLSSFDVKVNDASDLASVAAYIESSEGVESVKYGEGMVESILDAFSVVQKGTIAVVLALILVTIFLIGNTIKLTIFSRRSDIEIMRLVGASNVTIKLPFIFEGFLVGAIGSIIPVCTTVYGYIIFYSQFDGVLFSNMLVLISPYNFIFLVALLLVFIGGLVGAIGSLRAVRKHLKV